MIDKRLLLSFVGGITAAWAVSAMVVRADQYGKPDRIGKAEPTGALDAMSSERPPGAVKLALGPVRLDVESNKGVDPANRELEKFQGVWALESYTTEGVTKSASDRGTSFRGQRLIIKENHLVERFHGTPADIADDDDRLPRMQFEIAPTKSPARIDYWPVNRPDGWRKLGIYKLEGDKLTICFRGLVPCGDDVKRPVEFNANEGSRAGMAVYKRLR